MLSITIALYIERESNYIGLIVTMTTDAITGAPRPGQHYRLYCHVTGGGAETPMYWWYRNGEVTSATPSVHNSIGFAPAREWSHNGVWSCEATKGSLTGRSAGLNITVMGNTFPLTCKVNGFISQLKCNFQ